MERKRIHCHRGSTHAPGLQGDQEGVQLHPLEPHDGLILSLSTQIYCSSHVHVSLGFSLAALLYS